MAARTLFESNLAGWAVAIIIALGGVLITVDQFRFAEALWLLAVLWSLLWLWFQPYRGTRFDLIITMVALMIGSTLIYFTESYRIERILDLNNGLLLPANDDTPDACQHKITEKEYVIAMGVVTAYTDYLPQNIVGIDNQTMISANVKNGLLAIDANIFDDNGKVIAIIDDNNFTLNTNNYFKKYHPDFSSIVVIDQFNREVLNVRFSNPHTVKIYGLFKYGGHYLWLTPNLAVADGDEHTGNSCISGRFSKAFLQLGNP